MPGSVQYRLGGARVCGLGHAGHGGKGRRDHARVALATGRRSPLKASQPGIGRKMGSAFLAAVHVRLKNDGFFAWYLDPVENPGR
jgi:hypothetical protein